MKLEAGKWYNDRGTGKWRIDWVGTAYACGHSECGSVCTWAAVGGYALDLGKKHLDLVSEWTEPKLRPWACHEVPDCWIRRKKGNGTRMRIVAVDDSRIAMLGASNCFFSFNLAHAVKELEHSVDGVTWKPCGVEE